MSLLAAASTLLCACWDAEQRPEGFVRLSLSQSLRSLDPIDATDYSSQLVLSQIYETLISYENTQASSDRRKLKPQLLEKMPTYSDRGKKVHLSLRKNVFFHDHAAFKKSNGRGRKLVAGDIVYSWKRLWLSSQSSSDSRAFFSKIVGLSKWREGVKSGSIRFDDDIEGLIATDEQNLELEFSEPFRQFELLLTQVMTAPVPFEALAESPKALNLTSVGTGPYKLKSADLESQILLEKNESYWGSVENNGVEFYKMSDSQPRWLNFMKGELDWITVDEETSMTAYEGGQLQPAVKEMGISEVTVNSPDIVYLAFNMEDAVVGRSRALRQAISMSIDRNAILSSVYMNLGSEAHGPIPIGVEGFRSDFKNPYSTRDLEKAKELLAKAGYNDEHPVPTLTIESLSDAANRRFAEVFKSQLKEVGIEVKISLNSWPELVRKQKQKEGQIYGPIAWIADYLDPANIFQLFLSSEESPGLNVSNYNNYEFDRLFRKSLKEEGRSERTEVYEKMLEIIIEDSPWVFLVHRKIRYLVHPWISNFSPDRVDLSFIKNAKVDLGVKKNQKQSLFRR